MDQFKYKTYIYKPTGFYGGIVDEEAFQAELNRFGSEGWELVSAVSSNQNYGSTRGIVCIFKQKIEANHREIKN